MRKMNGLTTKYVCVILRIYHNNLMGITVEVKWYTHHKLRQVNRDYRERESGKALTNGGVVLRQADRY